MVVKTTLSLPKEDLAKLREFSLKTDRKISETVRKALRLLYQKEAFDDGKIHSMAESS